MIGTPTIFESTLSSYNVDQSLVVGTCSCGACPVCIQFFLLPMLYWILKVTETFVLEIHNFDVFTWEDKLLDTTAVHKVTAHCTAT